MRDFIQRTNEVSFQIEANHKKKWGLLGSIGIHKLYALIFTKKFQSFHFANIVFSMKIARVLLIDNHDSFTWNLASLLDSTGLCDLVVKQNQEINLKYVSDFDRIVISPGPGLPSERPILSEIVKEYCSSKPILGVCLGLQVIVETFGGRLINMSTVAHGQQQLIKVCEAADYMFRGLAPEFKAGLYHSWAADPSVFPDELEITAINSEKVVMGVRHRQFETRGIQFHPESYMTIDGRKMMMNWLKGPS